MSGAPATECMMVAITTEVEAPRAPCSHCSVYVVLQDSTKIYIDDPFHRRHYSANIKAFLSDSKRINKIFLIDIYRLVVHAQMPELDIWLLYPLAHARG